MAETVVVGGEVKGDITSCKIENQTKSVHRDSVSSVTQTTNYISYDACSKTVLEEYSVPEPTGVGFIIFFALLFAGLVSFGGMIASFFDNEKELSAFFATLFLVVIGLFFWIF